jgi:hypothetical protein
VDIADVHARLLPEIHEKMGLVRDKPRIAELSRTFEELSVEFEALGLCHLLEGLDLAQLTENLCRSGHARRYFLRRSQAEGNLRDRRLALGRTRAFLDAVVAGDLALAGDIATLSGTRWEPDWEYEDDFCYSLFLHRTILGANGGVAYPSPELPAILDRFETALDGGDSARLDACRALLARDAKRFLEALEARLEEIQAELDVERDSSAVQEDFDVGFWPRSFVCIEGLALLQIAGIVGVATPRDVPLCPKEARLPVRPNGYPDFFVEMERMP